MIAFRCTGCGNSLKVKDEVAGHKGRCPHCQQPMTVPAATDGALGERHHQQLLDAEPVLPPRERTGRRLRVMPLLLGILGLLGLGMFVLNIVRFVRKPEATVMVPNDNSVLPDPMKERRSLASDENQATPPERENDPGRVPNVQGGEPKRDPGVDDLPAVPPKPLNKAEPLGRRAPSIKNIHEAAVVVVRVPVDTYIFNENFDQIMVLKNQADKAPIAAKPGANNAFAKMYKGLQPPGMEGGAAVVQRQMGQFRNLRGREIQGADEKRPDYVASFVKLADLKPGLEPDSDYLARQPRPAHMAIIAGSFPYTAQLDEFKSKLHLPSRKAVLGETVEEGADKLPAFRFLGVQVQRQERDADGRAVSDWNDLNIAESYKLWMLHSGLQFEPDDPKYEALKPLFQGLVMPRLRAFHDESQQNPMAKGPPMPGAAASPQDRSIDVSGCRGSTQGNPAHSGEIGRR